MLTLNRKGQGLTEYGIILLLLVIIGLGVYSTNTGIKQNISSMYENTAANLEDIIGYDTGKNISSKLTKDGTIIILHETKLSYKGNTIYWYTTSAGIKQYTTGSTADAAVSALNYMNYADYPNATFYFQTNNTGKYYAISANGTSIRRYTGDTTFMNGQDFASKNT